MSELEFTDKDCKTLDAIESYLIRRHGIRIVFRTDRNTIPALAPDFIRNELNNLKVDGYNVAQWRNVLKDVTGYDPVFVSPNGVIPAGHTLIKNLVFKLDEK